MPKGLRAPSVSRPPRPAAATRVLMAASESFPLVKTGGLADVTAALSQALVALGLDVRLVLPAYPGVADGLHDLHCDADLGSGLGHGPMRLLSGRMPASGMPVWLLECDELFGRDGTPYLDSMGAEWPDNALRFGLFSRIVSALALGRVPLADGWQPDVVHCHDWQTGLVPLLLSLAGEPRPRSVMTIHNAAFQGNFPLETATELGLPAQLLQPEGVEFYGRLSFLKAGIRHADKLTTVSATYAREILTPEFGCGLDGLLRTRAKDLVGIMNGIDATLWDPAGDPHLASVYSAQDRSGKALCKADLQRSLQLRVDPEAPLAISASRLTSQKMADVLLAKLPELMMRQPRLQLALMGRGDRSLERGFIEMARYFPGRIGVQIDYSEPLAHRFQAGGDLLLHGARFEPCGLVQLYAMRYGTIPVVRRVGGLADSVTDCAQRPWCSTGFAFDEPTGRAMLEAVDRGVEAYERRPEHWQALQRNAMSADFSWRPSAQAYACLYAGLLGHSAPAEAAVQLDAGPQLRVA